MSISSSTYLEKLLHFPTLYLSTVTLPFLAPHICLSSSTTHTYVYSVDIRHILYARHHFGKIFESYTLLQNLKLVFLAFEDMSTRVIHRLIIIVSPICKILIILLI